jgi:DNA-binding LacI/PurR family transcriptional regulator
LLDWDDFHWENFSIVRIGHSVPAPAAHVVAPDQVGDTILAYNRMRELGYERIGFVCGRESAAQPRRWFSGGYLMMQINEPVGRRIPPLVHGPEHSSQDLLHKLGDWLRRHKPDAVLTEHAGILALLKAANWKVPGQIGVAALSVLDGGADAGIYQNAQEIGRVAAETVIAQINRNERGCLENFRTTMIRGRWVDGKTLPPRA